MIGDPDRLYKLLPALYRERDEREGLPLRDLLRLINQQTDIVYDDIQRLWDNFFIETSERWAIAYIGDLVGNNLLHETEPREALDTAREFFLDLAGPDLKPPNVIRRRADVAKTIYYRRRKGTLPMLEELARDVTGWAAHAVEFFELLVWSQNLNHVRLLSAGCPDLRDPEIADRVNGPFDTFAHTVDVRFPRQSAGWYNIRNIVFFLWRLKSYGIENVVARVAAQQWQFHFSPLGNLAPPFSKFRREAEETGLATEPLVPGPIRPAAFYKTPAEFYGLNGFTITRDGVPVPLTQVRCHDLENWVQPAGNLVTVDLRRGRMAFGAAFVPAQGVDVFYHYGFSADLGGGPYERSKWLVDRTLPAVRLSVREGGVPPNEFPTVNDAVTEWINQGRPNCVISILDNRNYALASPLELADDRFLAIEAADTKRPHIIPEGGELRIDGSHPGAEFTLSGVLFEGAVRVAGDTRRLRLLHTTLVPGRGLREDGTAATALPSVIVEDAGGINRSFRLHAAFSITGPLRLPRDGDSLVLLDSIVDGLGDAAIAATGTNNQPGPPATLERVTILGRSFFRRLPLASEVIFAGRVETEQKQQGCVRFSSVPSGSVTPRRFRCQPDLEIATRVERAEKQKGSPLTAVERNAVATLVRVFLKPAFTDARYGQPAYAQLRLGCPVQIRTGAEDGSEMGAFSHLKQPQRETNLRVRLEEYLPFGLDPGVIYVT